MAVEMPPGRRKPSRRTFAVGALFLGFGLGGLADGILLHQLLQWHNLVSRRVPNDTLDGLRANLLWDGVFHATTTVLVAAGLVVLWIAWERGRHAVGNLSALIGLALVGWGAFHVTDQLIFHELLGLHDIREVPEAAIYNWGFFAIGLLLAAGGWALYRTRGVLGASALERSRPRHRR